MSLRWVRRPAAWQLCLAVGVVVTALYYAAVRLGSGTSGLQVALYASANATLTVTATVAARRYRRLRLALLLLAASALAAVAADLVFYFMALVVGEVAYPSVADIGYLAAYVLMAAGLLALVRLRTPSWDWASGIDAAIVAVSTGYLTFVFFVVPTLAGSPGWSVAELVSVAYPVGDLMLISVGARLVLGAGPRTPAFRYCALYLGMVLCADTLYGIQTLNGTYQAGNYLDALWIMASYVLGAGMLHPSLPKMAADSPVPAPDATAGRLVVLAVAALAAPGTLLLQQLRGGNLHPAVTAITCSVLFLLVIARMAGLVRAQRLAAITDGLTGLRTRRFFQQALQVEAKRAHRTSSPLGMLLLDVDHFKRVNDTYGHGSGDLVLVEIAHRMRALVRPGDLVARYGGEEFAILLPCAGAEQVLEVGERVRRGLAAAPFALGGGVLHTVTASLGAASMPEPCHTTDELLLAADRALYAAKNAGRNRIAPAWAA